jgi:hypothetical protein
VALGYFFSGMVIGGAASSSVLFALGSLVHWVPLMGKTILVGIAAISLVLHERGVVSLPLPQNHRQVPRSVFDRRAWSAALQFGFELGTGMRTYLSATAPYLLALGVMMISGELMLAISAGIGFGAGRFGMILVRFLSRSELDWDERLLRRLRWLPTASLLAVGVGVTSVKVV